MGWRLLVLILTKKRAGVQSFFFFFFKRFRGTESKDETTKGTVSAPTLLSLKWHQNHMDSVNAEPCALPQEIGV